MPRLRMLLLRVQEGVRGWLHFLQRVRIRFLRFRCLRINRGIAGGIFPLEVFQLLGQREYPADYALDVLQRVAAELCRPPISFSHP